MLYKLVLLTFLRHPSTNLHTYPPRHILAFHGVKKAATRDKYSGWNINTVWQTLFEPQCQ